MYKEDHHCKPPADNTVLWRYMDFTKFVSLLDRSALFFTRADKLGDPFEGSLPHPTRHAARQFHEGYPDNLQTMFNAIKQKSQYMLISCWHENDRESAAMWRLYSKDDSGIAIKTTFHSFKRSFTCSAEVLIGQISYLDYETDTFTYNSPLAPFLSKRKSFEHEREVRAIIQTPPPEDGKAEKGKQIVCSEGTFDVGNYYKVDLSLLVQEVVVAPYAPDWLLELIKAVATRYDLMASVKKSPLADNPTWD